MIQAVKYTYGHMSCWYDRHRHPSIPFHFGVFGILLCRFLCRDRILHCKGSWSFLGCWCTVDRSLHCFPCTHSCLKYIKKLLHNMVMEMCRKISQPNRFFSLKIIYKFLNCLMSWHIHLLTDLTLTWKKLFYKVTHV